MQPDFWHQRWRDNLIGFHQQAINTHLQEYWYRLGLTRGSRVFVPLCGKSRDMLWLLEQGHRVLGVEISPIAVQDFFSENNLSPVRTRGAQFERWTLDELHILCGDFFALAAEDVGQVAAVYDRASLIALPADMRTRYARHLMSICPPGVQVLLVTLEYSQEEMPGPPFSVAEHEVYGLYEEYFLVERLYENDVLDENARFREKGLSRLRERVFLLKGKGQ
jgi:thiopurine S-methyltransferase